MCQYLTLEIRDALETIAPVSHEFFVLDVFAQSASLSHPNIDFRSPNLNVTRSWNEIVVKNVTTTGISNHNNVLIYKIDENTELLMAVNSGDKYTINLSTKRKNAYIFK